MICFYKLDFKHMVPRFQRLIERAFAEHHLSSGSGRDRKIIQSVMNMADGLIVRFAKKVFGLLKLEVAYADLDQNRPVIKHFARLGPDYI